MKRISILLILFSAITLATVAQKPSGESIRKRFSLGFTVNQDFWMKVPDSITPRTVNQGIDVFGLYNFPMDRKGHLFFFAGAGIGAHNFYHNGLLEQDDNVTVLRNIPAKTLGGATTDTKSSKFSITYLDIPFGFQYKATNKLHATLGFKVGWKLNDHSRYKGNYYNTDTYTQSKVKFLGLENVEKMHYGPYISLGYRWYAISAFYQIPSVFTKDLGPQIYPISVGITLRPF